MMYEINLLMVFYLMCIVALTIFFAITDGVKFALEYACASVVIMIALYLLLLIVRYQLFDVCGM